MDHRLAAVRLERFAVLGFQSYETRQELRLNPDTTLLAGRNNVGKSALLRAIRYPVQPEEGNRRELSLDYQWRLTTDDVRQRVPLGYEASGEQLIDDIARRGGSCVLTATLITTGEGRSSGEQPMPNPVSKDYANSLEFREIRISAENSELLWLGLKSRAGESPAHAYLWLADGRDYNPERQRLVELARHLVHVLLPQHYLISPRRSTERMPYAETTVLSSDGSNLTAVVATLFTTERRQRFALLEDFLRNVFPEVSFLEVPMRGSGTPIAEIFLALGRRGGMVVPLKHSGTGVEQVLMLATAVLTAPPGYLFLVDEPHAFLHPVAERKVLAFIRAHSEHQYLIATHSPAFLTAYPIGNSRLVTIDDDGTHVTDAGTHSAILSELGITAADLWSSEAILWAEGDSDVAISRAVVETGAVEGAISVRPMPDAIRASARAKRQAKAASEMCAAIAEAVLPVHVRMAFLFDSDERSAETKAQITEATAGTARFLPVREMENLLLSPIAIQSQLAALCRSLGASEPTLHDIEVDLDELIGDTASRDLYPEGAERPSADRVVGSEVLTRLFRKWATSEYDKVRDGEQLARRVVAVDGSRLEPLVAELRLLAS